MKAVKRSMRESSDSAVMMPSPMRCALASLNDDRRIVLVDIYSHGVVWAVFEDSEHRRAIVCIDGRPTSATRNRLFERVRHPTKPGAVLVDLGAPEERIAIAMLSKWCDDEEASRRSGATSGMTEEGIEMVRDALLHLGDTD